MLWSPQWLYVFDYEFAGHVNNKLVRTSHTMPCGLWFVSLRTVCKWERGGRKFLGPKRTQIFNDMAYKLSCRWEAARCFVSLSISLKWTDRQPERRTSGDSRVRAMHPSWGENGTSYFAAAFKVASVSNKRPNRLEHFRSTRSFKCRFTSLKEINNESAACVCVRQSVRLHQICLKITLQET